MSDNSQDDLRAQIMNSTWTDLREHLLADRLIYIDSNLDLVDVGAAVRDDDKDQVEYWIACGKIAKPAKEELARWDETPSRVFRILIVQPFVIFQEAAH